MEKATVILTIGLVFFLGTVACSKKEPPPPAPKKLQKIKIVKPVEVQEPEKQKAPISSGQERAKISAKEPEADKVAAVGEVPKTETGEAKPAGVEEKPAQMQERAAEGEQTADEETETYYIVKKGESLCDVASREDVYGNKLKWPLLFRHNIDTLDSLKTEDDVAERALPAGLKLRIISRDEVEKNLEKRRNRTWVVNALSISTNGEIIPLAITLMKNGHKAYLAKVTIKGKKWTRLRVGFFTSRAEADAEKEKIKDLLHLCDPWSIELTEEEFEEFAGY